MVFSDIYLTLFFPWCVIFVSNSPSPCCWPSLAFSLSLSPVQNAISPSSPFQKKPFPFHRQPSEFLDQDDNNHVIVHKNRKCWKISVGLTASVETEWSQYFGTLRNFGAILSSQMCQTCWNFPAFSVFVSDSSIRSILLLSCIVLHGSERRGTTRELYLVTFPGK